MSKTRILASALGVVAVASLAGCAIGTPAAPHQHMRDAKQGATRPRPQRAPTPGPVVAPAPTNAAAREAEQAGRA